MMKPKSTFGFRTPCTCMFNGEFMVCAKKTKESPCIVYARAERMRRMMEAQE